MRIFHINMLKNAYVIIIVLIVGNSFGAGNYAMCGKAYDPRLIVAWPTARIAVMGGDQAAKVLTQIQVAALKKNGQNSDIEAEQKLVTEIRERYERQTTPYYAASRLWVDAIIDPRMTREWISIGIEMADHGVVENFNPGVLQT